MARREHAAVVIELGPRVDAGLRLDPRPLDREPEGIQPKTGRDFDVFAIAVIAVEHRQGS